MTDVQIITDAQIFQLLGIVYLAVGLGIIINPEFYKKLVTDFTDHPPAIYVGGIVALVIGSLLVIFHNDWKRDWTVIITILGWAVLVKGLFLIVLPKMSIKVSNAFKEMKKLLRLWAVIVIVLGVLLCCLGFFVV